jgi:hypothetical protein
MEQKRCSNFLSHSVFGEPPKSSRSCCPNWTCIHGDLYYGVKYSNVAYQDQNFSLSRMLKHMWLDLVFGQDFMTLSNF